MTGIPDLAELEQLYTLRIAVECIAIRISVPRLRESDLERLRAVAGILEARAAARDVDGWEGPHREFHRGLVAYAGEQITELAARLQQRSHRYRRMYVTQEPQAWWHTTAEHAAILRACEARDPTGAAVELARHYARTALTVIALIDPQHDPASVRAAVSQVVPSQPDASLEPTRYDGIKLKPAKTGAGR